MEKLKLILAVPMFAAMALFAVPALAACGDEILDEGETCDDGNATAYDGCSDTCLEESGWVCDNDPMPSLCAEDCGDGVIIGDEECDDGNEVNDDGCASFCSEETGWYCEDEPSVCYEDTGEGDVQKTLHVVLVASAPFICLAVFIAACWGWPLRRRK